MPLSTRNVARELDHANPAMSHAQLGSTLLDLLAAYNDLSAKHNALLAKLDTANVTGMGTTNTASFATATPSLTALGARTLIA